MLSKQTLSSKFTIAGLLLLALVLGNLKYKQWHSHQEIEKQKQRLETQANELQKKNDELNQSLQYLNSPGFKERLAREQLGLKKEGEQVYSFTNGPQVAGQQIMVPDNKSNVEKWWDYFFSNN